MPFHDPYQNGEQTSIEIRTEEFTFILQEYGDAISVAVSIERCKVAQTLPGTSLKELHRQLVKDIVAVVMSIPNQLSIKPCATSC